MVDFKLPKPTTLQLSEGPKYSVLLIPMGMVDLADKASNKGWIDSVHTNFDGFGYRVFAKNLEESREIGPQFLGKVQLDDLLKKPPEIGPVQIKAYAKQLGKIEQTKQERVGRLNLDGLPPSQKVPMGNKEYDVIAIPAKHPELEMKAIGAGYRFAIIKPEADQDYYIYVATDNEADLEQFRYGLFGSDYSVIKKK